MGSCGIMPSNAATSAGSKQHRILHTITLACMFIQTDTEHSMQVATGKAKMGYKLCIALNAAVIVVGVIMTASVNGVMFKNNDQDLGKQEVFWAAFEQPLTSFLVLVAASALEFVTSFVCTKTAHHTAQSTTDGV